MSRKTSKMQEIVHYNQEKETYLWKNKNGLKDLKNKKLKLKKEMELHKILDLESSFDRTKSKSKNKGMSQDMVRILF